MCKFFSAIQTKSGLIWDYDEDSHEFLIEKGKLNDKGYDPEFVRLELLPKDGNIFNHNLKNWKLVVDQDFIPEWFSKEFAEKEMKTAIKKVWAERFMVDCEIEELRNRKIRYVLDTKIERMIDSRVGEMWGSSWVGEMCNFSQVGKMFNFSQVGKMFNFSQVGEMWGSSQVGKMFSSSQVGKMFSSSQVGEMWGSSWVGAMWDSSQVGEMWGSSQVCLWSAQVIIKHLNDTATIKDLSGKTPKIIIPGKEMEVELFKP